MAVSRPTHVRQLQELGVRALAPLMVHASLRRLGLLDGGADDLLDDFQGPGGTLLMALGAAQDGRRS
jgi:aminoglycoside N3'-acetyltransferase